MFCRKIGICAGLLLAAACGRGPMDPTTPPVPGGSTGPATSGGIATLVGAGDIGACNSQMPERTAALLDSIPGTVFTAGDNALPSGTAEHFRLCYEPNWGRHRARTRPAPGNHDYETAGASGYFGYFGANAGPAGLGYYSYDLEGWHVVSLNSETAADSGSAQMQWLRADLAGRSGCTLAYWHRPVFGSGANGSDPHMRDVWRTLFEAGVDVVIAGHNHSYERFAPLDADGRVDPVRGMRQFVVGTGGAPLTAFPRILPGSEARGGSHGVLKLTLGPGRYEWEFIPVEGSTFRDAGAGQCH